MYVALKTFMVVPMPSRFVCTFYINLFFKIPIQEGCFAVNYFSKETKMNEHLMYDVKYDVIDIKQITFREINSGKLTKARCYKSSLVFTIVDTLC